MKGGYFIKKTRRFYNEKNIYHLSLIVLLAGCCTEANYQRLLNSRLDMPEDELIAQIGNPTSVYDTNGKRSLEYKYSNFFL